MTVIYVRTMQQSLFKLS